MADFRSRKKGESLGDYLAAKKAATDVNINLGAKPPQSPSKPSPTKTSTKRKYIDRYPGGQKEYQEFKSKYTYDPDKQQWYEEVEQPAGDDISSDTKKSIQEKIDEIKQKASETAKGVAEYAGEQEKPEVQEEANKLAEEILGETPKKEGGEEEGGEEGGGEEGGEEEGGDDYVSTEDDRKGEKKKEEEEEDEGDKEIEDKDKKIDDLARDVAIKRLQDEIGIDTSEKPERPDLRSTYETLRDEKGVDKIEEDINEVDSQITELQDSYVSGLYDEEGRVASMKVITGRQQKLKQQLDRQLATLQRQKEDLQRELKIKQNHISNIMELEQTDYQNAKNDYNTKFNQAIQLNNAYETAVSQAEKEEQREKEDARANLQVIQNLISNTNKTWDDLSDSMQQSIFDEERRAGLPEGTYQSLMDTIGVNSEIMATIEGVNRTGEKTVTFIYKDPNTGTAGVVETVKTGLTADEEGDLDTFLSKNDYNELASKDVKDPSTGDTLKFSKDIASFIASMLEIKKTAEKGTIIEALSSRSNISPGLASNYYEKFMSWAEDEAKLPGWIHGNQ